MKDEIINNHPMGFDGIKKTFTWNDIIESHAFRLSIIISLCLFVTSFFSSKSLYDILILWVNQITTIFPNLLGFNLGGFALIVGFGNTEFIKSMTKLPENKKVSIFQKVSSIFAFMLLIQTATFSLAFIVNFLIQFSFVSYNLLTYYIINSILILILSSFCLWGIFILPQLIINVFTFGQSHHFLLTLKRIVEEEEIKKSKKNETQ